MTAKIILVTGGARSGKSAFAEEYARKCGEKTAYFATAQIFDTEMNERIEAHKMRRPASWTTYETPFDAEWEMKRAVNRFDVILFDCLTVYTSNLLLRQDMPSDRLLRQQFILAKTEKLLQAAGGGQAKVVFVTNEVGLGIVPDNPLAREFRDIAGFVNQNTAACADELYLLVCGVPIRAK